MRADRLPDIAALEDRLGHHFRRGDLRDQALTHRSFGAPHNERLEFLGDGVLGCVAAELLLEKFPHCSEGELSRRDQHLHIDRHHVDALEGHRADSCLHVPHPTVREQL